MKRRALLLRVDLEIDKWVGKGRRGVLALRQHEHETRAIALAALMTRQRKPHDPIQTRTLHIAKTAPGPTGAKINHLNEREATPQSAADLAASHVALQ